MSFSAQFVTLQELQQVFGAQTLINATDDSGAAETLNEDLLTTLTAAVEAEIAMHLSMRYATKVEAGETCQEVKNLVYALLAQELQLRTHSLAPEVSRRAEIARDTLRRLAWGELHLASWASDKAHEVTKLLFEPKSDLPAPWDFEPSNAPSQHNGETIPQD